MEARRIRFLIVGGTGTLGYELTKQLLAKKDCDSITIFSRCELKQKEMQSHFKDERLSFVLGDIRCKESLSRAFLRNSHYHTVFHVAALKHVDVLENNPEEAIRTNVLGSINVANECERTGVIKCVFSSTDKAVEPINAYGASKMLAEKILFQRNKTMIEPIFAVFRWGNILGSRGSVLSSFVKSIRKEKKAYVTDLKMTRFWITIKDAVEFMLKNYASAPSDKAMILKCKSFHVVDLAAIIAHQLGKRNITYIETGKRPGEKVHEKLELDWPSSQKTEEWKDKDLAEKILPFVEAL